MMYNIIIDLDDNDLNFLCASFTSDNDNSMHYITALHYLYARTII